MGSGWSSFRQGAWIRQIVVWTSQISIAALLLFVAVYEIPAYRRRSELQSRVFRGRVSLEFGPFVHAQDFFHSRSRIPEPIRRFLGENWVLPLEPITVASLVAKSGDDVRKLATEIELEKVIIVAEGGKCTDQLLRHLTALPKLQSLTLCNIAITDLGIDLLLQMTQLKELHIECATEPSPGLMRLSQLSRIESFGLMDARCAVADEVYEQIGLMPNLEDLRLSGSKITAARCAAIAASPSIRQLRFAYMDCNLTYEHVRILAAMKRIRCVEFRDWHNSLVEADAQEHLSQQSLLPDPEEPLRIPRL